MRCVTVAARCVRDEMRSGSGSGFKRLREMRPFLCALVCLGLKVPVCERQQKKKKEGNIKTCVFRAESRRRRDVPSARMKSSGVLHIFRH